MRSDSQLHRFLDTVLPRRHRSDDAAIDALKAVPLFDHLNGHQGSVVLRHLDHVTVDAGAILAQQDARSARELIVILRGSVCIERDRHLLARLGPGGIVGDLSLLDGEPRTATAIADTETEIFILGQEGFSALLEIDPDFQRKLMLGFVDRLRATDEIAAGVAA